MVDAFGAYSGEDTRLWRSLRPKSAEEPGGLKTELGRDCWLLP